MKQFMIIVIMLATVLSACQQQKESKEIAEEKNEAKFENKSDEKDAQFVVETVSSLHALIALSDVAIEKDSKLATKTASEVKPDFQTLLGEAESYAHAHVISVPVEATDRATNSVRKLLDAKPSEFDSKWCNEIRDRNKALIGNLESYGNKTTDINLKTWLNSALPTARMVQDKFVDFENKLSARK